MSYIYIFYIEMSYIFSRINFNLCSGCSKEPPIETVLLSTHNICAGGEIRKILVFDTYSQMNLQLDPGSSLNKCTVLCKVYVHSYREEFRSLIFGPSEVLIHASPGLSTTHNEVVQINSSSNRSSNSSSGSSNSSSSRNSSSNSSSSTSSSNSSSFVCLI